MSRVAANSAPPVDGLVLEVNVSTAGGATVAMLHWPASWPGRPPAPARVDIREETFATLPAHALDRVTLSTGAVAPPPRLLGDTHRVLRPGGQLNCAFSGSGTARAALAQSLAEIGFVDIRSTTAGSWEAHKASVLPVPLKATPQAPPDRLAGYALLAGDGLEIGAFTEPAPLSSGCRVRYFDALDAPTARERFPELDPAAFVEVDYVGDVDRGDLARFTPGEFDFVVCNHVIEHVANPVRLVRDLFQLVRPGGHVVIAAPDKRFTFDHERALTSFDHLWADYEADVGENSDEHYLDFLRHAVPHVLAESPENLLLHVQRCRLRKDHAHVWDSVSFRSFLERAIAQLHIAATRVYEADGDRTRIEYFSVWRKS